MLLKTDFEASKLFSNMFFDFVSGNYYFNYTATEAFLFNGSYQ